jgi:hypothetical protein
MFLLPALADCASRLKVGQNHQDDLRGCDHQHEQRSECSDTFESLSSSGRLGVDPTHTFSTADDIGLEGPAADPILDLLDEVAPEHPALQRLADRRNATQPVEASITSYDRLHHRHNRS